MRNVTRDYLIEASADLFGQWIVTLSWGRIGTFGQSRKLSFAEQAGAARFVRTTLTCRASSRRRIGDDYCVATALMASMTGMISTPSRAG